MVMFKANKTFGVTTSQLERVDGATTQTGATVTAYEWAGSTYGMNG